jgi:hypothetical protein
VLGALGEHRGEHASDDVAVLEPQVFVLGRASTAGHGGYFRMPDNPSTIRVHYFNE